MSGTPFQSKGIPAQWQTARLLSTQHTPAVPDAPYMEYKPAVYNIGRDVVTSLEPGHMNGVPTLIVLQPHATALIVKP